MHKSESHASFMQASQNAVPCCMFLLTASANHLLDLQAWWATEMGEVGPEDVVAIWGAGPGATGLRHCSAPVHRWHRPQVRVGCGSRAVHCLPALYGLQAVLKLLLNAV